MCKNLDELTVFFAVSRQLPIVGISLECAIIENGFKDRVSMTEIEITPTEVTSIDKNIAKIKTAIPNVTFVVMYPTLEYNNTFVGKIKTLPYPDSIFDCDLIDFHFDSLNDFTVSWKKCNGGKVVLVKKCAQDVYLICTENRFYLLMKDNA